MTRSTRLLAALGTILSAVAANVEAQPALRVRSHATGLSSPVAIVQDPTDRTVQFVVQQGGRIKVVKSGAVLGTDFLDLRAAISSGGERGLLGLALAPDYAATGRFFVNFTNPAGHTVVARFTRSGNPLVADPASRFDLHWISLGGVAFISQPYPNHNGGTLAFGPDGYLYIGLGDGGSGDDPENRAQNPGELLGKMLRIDVNVSPSDPNGYRVPANNPFVGSGFALPEIWSFGLRNPWKYSFDDPARGGTGAMLIADVGQNAWEEVDYEPANRGGRNYGWRVREGAHDRVTMPGPAYTPLTEPIHEYGHSVGTSITGGFVYRGGALGPFYRGRYFFADFVAGRVWSLGLSVNPSTGEATAGFLIEHTAELGGVSRLGNISAFGVNADGELLIASYSRGEILEVQGSALVATEADWDGDGRAEIAVYRPTTGEWFLRLSTLGYGVAGYSLYQWGLAGDQPIIGDFDGDGRSDLTVYRPSSGEWFIRYSSTGYAIAGQYGLFQWGLAGDVPITGDFDGDRQTDLTVYRPSSGEWFIRYSSTGYAVAGQYDVYQWGLPGDQPITGDFDGDGRTDLTVYRPSTGEWIVRSSSSGYSVAAHQVYQWGLNGDVPIVGDFDGDGRTDLTVYRPSTGQWYLRYSGQGYSTASYGLFQWGLDGDQPVTLDFDGDGRTEIAVYRPSTGQWYLRYSAQGYATATYGLFQWGLAGDVPIR